MDRELEHRQAAAGSPAAAGSAHHDNKHDMPKPAKFYSVRDTRELFFPSCSPRWIKKTFRGGVFGSVMRNSAGWFISEQAILTYQQQHLTTPGNVVVLRPNQQAFADRQRG